MTDPCEGVGIHVREWGDDSHERCSISDLITDLNTESVTDPCEAVGIHVRVWWIHVREWGRGLQ